MTDITSKNTRVRSFGFRPGRKLEKNRRSRERVSDCFFQLTKADINSHVAWLFTKTLAESRTDNRYEAPGGSPGENRDMYFQRRRARVHPRLKSFVCPRCLSSGIFTVWSYYFIRLNLNTRTYPRTRSTRVPPPVATGLIIELKKKLREEGNGSIWTRASLFTSLAPSFFLFHRCNSRCFAW